MLGCGMHDLLCRPTSILVLLLHLAITAAPSVHRGTVDPVRLNAAMQYYKQYGRLPPQEPKRWPEPPLPEQWPAPRTPEWLKESFRDTTHMPPLPPPPPPPHPSAAVSRQSAAAHSDEARPKSNAKQMMVAHLTSTAETKARLAAIMQARSELKSAFASGRREDSTSARARLQQAIEMDEASEVREDLGMCVCSHRMSLSILMTLPQPMIKAALPHGHAGAWLRSHTPARILPVRVHGLRVYPLVSSMAAAAAIPSDPSPLTQAPPQDTSHLSESATL